jgi:hypothetical protein
MAIAYTEKQTAGTAAVGTYANLYATGANTAVIASVVICNEASSAVTVRMGFSATNGTTAPGTGKWLVYDRSIPANETVILEWGMSMSAGKYLNISSSAATVTFTAAVAEIS